MIKYANEIQVNLTFFRKVATSTSNMCCSKQSVCINLLCIIFILNHLLLRFCQLCLVIYFLITVLCDLCFYLFSFVFFSWLFLLFVLVWQAKHCVQGNSWLHEHRLHQHVYHWVYSQDCGVRSAGKEHPNLTTAATITTNTTQHDTTHFLYYR
jgi:hypothetical protein